VKRVWRHSEVIVLEGGRGGGGVDGIALEGRGRGRRVFVMREGEKYHIFSSGVTPPSVFE